MIKATRLKKTNLQHSRILLSILRHIGSRELPRRSGYYKHTWYGAIRITPFWIPLPLTHHSNRFPNVLILAEITLILPLSTACCERGFSVMGKIKSDWRSCLSVEVLDCLMRIRIEGPTTAEFDPQPGLNFWWSGGSRMRRPLFND